MLAVYHGNYGSRNLVQRLGATDSRQQTKLAVEQAEIDSQAQAAGSRKRDDVMSSQAQANLGSTGQAFQRARNKHQRHTLPLSIMYVPRPEIQPLSSQTPHLATVDELLI